MEASLSSCAEAAIDIARQAGEIARRWYEDSTFTVQSKADGSPVTQADREVERFIRDSLAEHFPHDGVLGEEYGETPGSTGRRWIVDPIDGTKSFVHGVPLWANLIALEDHGEITVGVVNLPSVGVLMHAERGGGCWRNGTRVHVSDRDQLEGAYVMATWLEDWKPEVIADMHDNGVVLRTWGDAYGYCLVASGHAEAAVDYRAQTYDLAPMPVIIEEAGGTFTSLDGHRDFNRGNGIASNGVLHDPIRKLLDEG